MPETEEPEENGGGAVAVLVPDLGAGVVNSRWTGAGFPGALVWKRRGSRTGTSGAVVTGVVMPWLRVLGAVAGVGAGMSLACSSSCLVPTTAIRDLEAIILAVSNAAAT
jgi:hypothetical protein